MSLEPIVREIEVPRAPDDAFRIFTAEMGTWWPLDRFSMSVDAHGSAPPKLVFEPNVGGRIYEVWTDGSERRWGRVTAWDPPNAVVFDWKPNDLDHPFTEIAATFEPSPSGGSRVRLEHRRWELLGADRGAEGREAYATGWPYVLDVRFAGAAA
jgi:uncharacterized protein YndB with AHSA1/START domain